MAASTVFVQRLRNVAGCRNAPNVIAFPMVGNALLPCRTTLQWGCEAFARGRSSLRPLYAFRPQPFDLLITAELWNADECGTLCGEVAGECVGMLAAVAHRYTPASHRAPLGLVAPLYVSINRCMIDKRWRCRGIGSRLVAEGIDRMRKALPISTVVYGYVASLHTARAARFWATCGFTIVTHPLTRSTMLQARIKDF